MARVETMSSSSDTVGLCRVLPYVSYLITLSALASTLTRVRSNLSPSEFPMAAKDNPRIWAGKRYGRALLKPLARNYHFLDTKGSIDCERIVVVIDDATSDHLSRKTSPQSSQIPFAAQNV